MKSIGIVLCNYNKAAYTLQCIQTILDSTIDDYQIYLVDNGSTDGSADQIRKTYQNQVILIENEQNLGSSGGYNTGIKRVLSVGHDYLMLLDNDTLLDEKALKNMRDYLIHHPDVGMVGGKIYHRHDPSYIQQYGTEVDLRRYQIKSFYADIPDSEQIPEIVECNTLPTTAVMLPISVVQNVGLLSEDYYFGWDDIDWGYRIHNAGYQIVALGSAKVIHEMAPFIRKEDTSTLYYQWRNAIYFFMRYTPPEKWRNMTNAILCTMFHSIYECSFREEVNMVTTIMHAYHDALYNRMGQATQHIILTNDENHSRFTKFFNTQRSIYIEPGGDWLIPILRMEHPSIHFCKNKEQADIVVRTCENIFILQECASHIIYVDKQLNIISNIEDEKMLDSYPFALDLFLYMHQEEFLLHLKEFRQSQA